MSLRNPATLNAIWGSKHRKSEPSDVETDSNNPRVRQLPKFLRRTVVPGLTEALTQLGFARPADPLVWLAEHLLTQSGRCEYIKMTDGTYISCLPAPKPLSAEEVERRIMKEREKLKEELQEKKLRDARHQKGTKGTIRPHILPPRTKLPPLSDSSWDPGSDDFIERKETSLADKASSPRSLATHRRGRRLDDFRRWDSHGRSQGLFDGTGPPPATPPGLFAARVLSHDSATHRRERLLHHKAATVIQARVRGVRVRDTPKSRANREIAKRNQLKAKLYQIEKRRRQKRHNAATKLQALQRGISGREFFSIIHVQDVARNAHYKEVSEAARRRMRKKQKRKNGRLREAAQAVLATAAVRIQAVHRGRQSRFHVAAQKRNDEEGEVEIIEIDQSREDEKELATAAVRIQAVHRGRQSRFHVAAQKRNDEEGEVEIIEIDQSREDEKELATAAVRIQAVHRGRQSRFHVAAQKRNDEEEKKKQAVDPPVEEEEKKVEKEDEHEYEHGDEEKETGRRDAEQTLPNEDILASRIQSIFRARQLRRRLQSARVQGHSWRVKNVCEVEYDGVWHKATIFRLTMGFVCCQYLSDNSIEDVPLYDVNVRIRECKNVEKAEIQQTSGWTNFSPGEEVNVEFNGKWFHAKVRELNALHIVVAYSEDGTIESIPADQVQRIRNIK
eukprot:g5393.t1